MQATVPADYPSEADPQAAYDANRKSLPPSSQYHLAMIFIRAPGLRGRLEPLPGMAQRLVSGRWPVRLPAAWMTGCEAAASRTGASPHPALFPVGSRPRRESLD